MVINKNYEICYESDASGLKGKVEKIFFPSSVKRVYEIIKDGNNLDIVPRGFGTSLVGGCVPNNSVVVDMRKMNKVTNLDGKNRNVKAEAGVSIKELNEKLRAVGYEFPIFSSDDNSIGGMIALNKISDRSMKYGEVKDWIEEIEIVNGRGEIVKISKTDLMDVCGMEGITGIIISAKLKIIPLIKRSISIFQADEIEEVISIAKRLKLEKEIVMLKFYSREVSKMLGFPKKYHIIIEFDSLRGKIIGEEYERIMKIKDKEKFFLYSNGYYNSVDPKLFYDKIEEFIELLEENEIPYSGDLGLGIIYPYFMNEEKIKIVDVFNFLKNIRTKFVKYGFGLKRKDLIEDSEKKVIKRVKMRYDPFGRINKGKVIEIEGNVKLVEINNGVENIVKEIKSPIKELEGFIEGVKMREEIKKKANDEIIEKKIKDYKGTFNSELGNNRVKKIEDFSKSISGKIIKKEEVNKDDFKNTLNKFGIGWGSDKKEDEDGNRD